MNCFYVLRESGKPVDVLMFEEPRRDRMQFFSLRWVDTDGIEHYSAHFTYFHELVEVAANAK